VPLTLMRLVSTAIHPIINIIVPMCLLTIGYSSTESLELIGIIFGMCMPIITIPSTIIGSINMVILPDISASTHNIPLLHNKIKTNYKLIMICSFIMLPIFIVLSEPICVTLYSNINAGYYLCYTAWLIIPMSIHQYFSSIMNALGKEKQNFIFSTIASIIMLIFILITTQYLNIFALPLGLGINSILASILCVTYIKKTTHYNHNVLSDIVLNAALCMITLLLDYFIYNIVAMIFPTIFCLIAISGISIISYLILIITFQYIDIGFIHGIVKG
ncbi:MAG: polysaccharide biosynthesis C-terminal domain-containing protein, partial [Clostridia bacterium]|nr:polysaccharide biosynthesis C-terminal domain-containing protein [Clostridia bacterium]